MTSLVKQMDCLNKDIDNCKNRIENGAKKRSSCSPSCYCCKDEGTRLDHQASSTRRKTISATVTKTDISPRLEKELAKSAEIFKTIGTPKRTETKGVRNGIMDHVHYTNKPAKFGRMPKCLSDDGCNNVEPVKLPKKSSRLKKEPSWSSVLQQNNNINCKENCHSAKKEDHIPVYSSSSSSVVSSAPIYLKNKGIQCGDITLAKQNQSSNYRDNNNTVQYHLMNLKDKLRVLDNPGLSKLFEEMELELRGILHDRGDCPLFSDIHKNYEIKEHQQNDNFDKFLHPRPNFYNQKIPQNYNVGRLESTYFELETICAKLKKERDSALEKASQKSVELVESMKREVETKAKLSETNSKIKEMSIKLETYTKSMEGLTDHVKRLQNENKDIERIRGQITQLSNMMREVTQENKNLLAELQLITIERNKLQVELAIKEQELEKKIKELEKMSNIFMESSKQIHALHSQRDQYRPEDSKQATLNLTSLKEDLHLPQLIASSPNTSSSDSVLHARINSWIAMSAISNGEQQVEHPANRGDGDAFVDDCNLFSEHTKLLKNMATSTGGLTNVTIKSQHLSQHTTNLEELNPTFQTEKSGKRPDLYKIEKLKEEIRRMFSEMRELARDVPSVPLVDCSSVVDSTEINWSDVSYTANSYDSISEFHSSELDFLKKNNK